MIKTSSLTLYDEVEFFKFTGILTDYPDWFWDYDYVVSKDDQGWCLWHMNEHRVCELVGIVSYGDYVVFFPRLCKAAVYRKEEVTYEELLW